MDGKSLTSVSKGCFVVRGKKKHKKRLDAGDYLTEFKLPDKERWILAQEVWKGIEDRVAILNTGLTSDIFADILNFVKTNGEYPKESGGKRAEIPVAALITGVNMPDHISLFNRLCDGIRTSVTPHVAVLCSKNCSNIKTVMRCIGQQLILGEADDLHDSSSDDLESDPITVEKGCNFLWKRSVPLTMPILEKWYSVVDHSVGLKTPKKRKKESSKNPAVVIVFRDTEAFLSNVLQDLITMFSTVVYTLPVVLVFGVATSWATVIDRQLPHSATVHLGIEKFYSPSASQHLTVVINDILLTSANPFKLSGKCMELLLDVFLCHDFSVTNFMMMLKFSVLEHFYEDPASKFCTNDMADVEKHADNASKEFLQHMRNLPSIKMFFSTLTSKQKESLMKSDREFRKLILNMIKDLQTFHEYFYPVMRSLFSLCKSLPKHPLGRHLRELYCACNHAQITDSEEYKQAKLLLQVSSRDQLTQRLNLCLRELEGLSAGKSQNKDSPNSLVGTVMDTITQLKSVISDLSRIDELKETEKDDGETSDEEAARPLEKVKYAYQLKEKLQTRSKERKMKKMTVYEKLRNKSIEILDHLFKKALIPPRSVPLHEVYYFDSTSTVKRHMVAAPRQAIQTALSDPRHYLQQSVLDATNGVIPASAPDVCVAYKLHNECGRIINLYDWLEAFHTIVTSGNEGDGPSNTEADEIDEITQAKFIRAASELQFLGFIKPTKRKTDHVQRLTWSHS